MTTPWPSSSTTSSARPRPTSPATSRSRSASILTVVVSLTLFGSAFMLEPGRRTTPTTRCKGGIEFIVFLQARRHRRAARRDRGDCSTRTPRSATSTTSTRTRPTRSSSASSSADELIRDRVGVTRGAAAVVPGRAAYQATPTSSWPSRRAVRGQARRLRGRRSPSRGREGHDQESSNTLGVRCSSSASACCVAALPADPQHDPHGDVRPPARDRGDEARRRHELVHPGAVHARGHHPGPGRLRPRARRRVRAAPLHGGGVRRTTTTGPSWRASSPRRASCGRPPAWC